MNEHRRLRTLLDVPNSQRRPMTRGQTEMFVRCVMLEREEAFKPRDATTLAAFIESDFPTAAALIFGKRLRAFSAPEQQFAPATVLILASLCDRTATVVQWAHYLVLRTHEVGLVDTMQISRDFPIGFPVYEACSELWDEQKRREDDPEGTPENALDARWPWQARRQETADA